MKKEYDFSNAEQGKFYAPAEEIKAPIYLDKDVEDFLAQRIQEESKGSFQTTANELLRKYREMEKIFSSQKLSDDIQRIGNRAVRKAQAENHAKGLPNVYGKNGVTYWQLPDGTMTMQNPLENITKRF